LPSRQRYCRPVLECLEDRCLLSAGFTQVNLASDVPGLARVTDPNLANPWGIALSPTGPFWFADNSSGVADLLDGRGQIVPLVVALPSPGDPPHLGAPTGTVFNGGAGFVIAANGLAAPSRFLLASADGTISGWSSIVDPAHAHLAVDNSSSGAVYTGLALGSAGHGFLYAADFSRATIDVFDEAFQPVVRRGAFQDPTVPAGFAPFNIQNINDRLFVTYAQQDKDGKDDVAGPGHGFIDVFDTAGNLLLRFSSQGPLNSPWGMALAPADFGPFGGALLVGNNGDGHINAYDPGSGTFLGQLGDDNGIPIVIPNLWALTFGNGHAGGASDTLFFAAGVDYDAHGLFGAIQSPQRKGADTAGPGVFDPHAPGEPGDYPLPPSAGPAFQTSNDNRLIPVSDLLPLSKGSSLVLAPTLSTVAPPGPTAPPGGRLSSGPVFSGSGGGGNDPVALSTFLDLRTSQTDIEKPTRVQWLDLDLHAVSARLSVPADRDPEAEEALAGAVWSEKFPVQSRQEQDAEALPPSGRAGDREVGEEQFETREGGWFHPIELIGVVGLSVIGAWWLRSEKTVKK
jgi:uncharacterized protein (TIGR03118 family)